jgi:hypothetical protein
MHRDCAMALKGLRSSSGAALSVHFDACAAKIRPQCRGARHPGGSSSASPLHVLSIMDHTSFLHCSIPKMRKNASISCSYGQSSHAALNFWPLGYHSAAAVHDLLKREEVKHRYDECIGGVSREAPLVSAPDSEAARTAGPPGTLADAGSRRVVQGGAAGVRAEE